MSKNVELLAGWPAGNAMRMPYSTDCLVVSIITSGSIDCEINLRPMSAEGPALMVLIPGRVIDKVRLSEDFSNKLFNFSPQFLEKMDLEYDLRTKLLISRQVFYSLDKERLEAFLTYYSLLEKILKMTDNPYTDQAVLNLTRAYFYSIGYYLHGQDTAGLKMNPHENVADRFLTLAEREFKRHRDVNYYAGQLCMTTKYLAVIVKEITGTTPMTWLARYTVLYAKSKLSGTKLTIQQISDSLSFPDQSAFGRYFKRIAGVSPKRFREESLAGHPSTARPVMAPGTGDKARGVSGTSGTIRTDKA